MLATLTINFVCFTIHKLGRDETGKLEGLVDVSCGMLLQMGKLEGHIFEVYPPEFGFGVVI